MRRLTIALCLLVAGPALAAPPASLRVIAPDPNAAGLRGAQSPVNVDSPNRSASGPSAPAALSPPIQSKAPLSFFSPAAQPATRDGGACRQTCARDYFFCLAGGDEPRCPQSWTRCRSDCGRISGPLP